MTKTLQPRFLIAAAVLLFSGAAVAQSHGSQPMDDPATARAVQQTQDMLRSRSELEKAANATPQAAESLKNLKETLGNDDSDMAEAQAISAEVFAKIAGDNKGDASKMQEAMLELTANPKLMEKYMTPEMKDRMSKLAKRVEEKQNRVPATR